jgi:hypothetical protein
MFGTMIKKFYSQMPSILEHANVQADLESYILTNRTGIEKNSRLAFKSYFTDEKASGYNAQVLVKVSYKEAMDISATSIGSPIGMSSKDSPFQDLSSEESISEKDKLILQQMKDLKQLVAKENQKNSELKIPGETQESAKYSRSIDPPSKLHALTDSFRSSRSRSNTVDSKSTRSINIQR